MIRVLFLILSLATVVAAEEAPVQQPVEGQVNPAIVPTPQPRKARRHAAKLKAVAARSHDLLLIGDSITEKLEWPANAAVWQQFFASRNALNLGYRGARTEHILWNLQNGELEGQSPKVVTLLIGINNTSRQDTGEQIAEGIEAIVKLLQAKLPATRILLLRGFPCGAGEDGMPTAVELDRASDLAMKLADGKRVVHLDINHVFLNPDGSINREMMPDLCHPSPEGVLRWAQAMEPVLCGLMGDESRTKTEPATPDAAK